MAIGRISGPLLKENLVRNGINIAFETDLLYLDVVNQRIGIKTVAPTHELQINGTTKTTNLIVDNRADIADVTIEGNTISTDQQYLRLGTFDNIVYNNKLRIDSIDIEGNVISTNSSNADLELRPNGTGTVEVYSDMNVDGNIHATGNISADGNIVLGDANTDNVVFNAEIASDLIPDQHLVYSLGSVDKKWKDVWVNTVTTSTLTVGDIVVDGVDLVLRQGNIYYVAENGSDLATGDHSQDPFASVKHALSVATTGDTIHIYPGVFTEEFPLTIPAGVTVKGQGIRSVKIVPTFATQNNDAFLLNGESTIEDITIADFYSPGYAFKFAPGFTVTSRSPYIRNISVITKGSVTTVEDPRGFNAGDAGRGGFFDGAEATTNSNEAAILFHSVTFITPGVDAIVLTNGVRVEWLNSFTYFANRSIYAYDSVSGLYGDGKTRIRLGGVTGTFAAGNTVTFTSADASTVVSVLVDSVENNVIAISGKNTDLVGFDTTPASISNGSGATATSIQSIDLQDFGAEVRLIGSASVYGNFGLVGDGPGVLMYAIGHNLAYIGNGKEVTNDPETVIQDNEVVELNDAKIRYTSVDHKGDFRVGDLFYVNQETGTVDLTSANFNVLTSGITFTDGSNVTFIDGTRIDTGNLRISGNTVESLLGDVNITAASDEINLNNNVNIAGNLDVTGNVSIGGNITIGNEPTDTIQFIAGIDSDIVPAQNSVYSLGTPSLRWSNIFVNEVTVDDISISNNYITTTASNTDLELRANGTGNILVPNNDVLINNELTVIGESTLGDVDVTGVLTVNGNVTQTGNYDIVGDVTINGSLTVSEYAQFEEIRIDDNFITTTTSNTNLELRANGTGVILVPNNNVQITNDLTVVANINANNLTTTGLVTADQFSTGDILIDNNVITTTLTNSDLELRANGTGDVVVPTNDVVLGQDLTVNGDTDLDNTTIQGTVTHTGNVTQVGNISLTGDYDITGTVTISSTAQFENIRINNNVVTTTDSNSDLELRAAGTGEVLVPNNDVVISNDLFVDGTITVGDINSAGTITANRFSTGDILIDDNFITTTALNSDLELRANGTGEVVVPNNDVIIEQDLTVNGATDLEDTTVTGTITHTGAVTQTGNINVTGNFVTTGTVTVSASAQFENIQVSGNVITTTSSNSNLELRANGTGIVSIPNNNVVVSNDLTVVGTFSAGNITSTGTIRANNFTTGDILIDDNFITTTTSNSNLELRANGTGSIVIDDFSINNATISSVSNFTIAPAGGSVIIDSTGAIKLPAGTTAERPTAVAGQIRFNSQLARFEGFNGTNWIQLHGVVDVDGDTRVTAELTEGANDNTIRFIVQNNTVVDINSTRLSASQLIVDSIQVDGNVISTITSNADLVLSANGAGRVRFENFAFQDNRITNTVSGSNTILQTTGTGYFEFTDPFGVVLPVGNNSNRPPGVTGMIRFNNADKRVELYDGTTWVSVAGASSGISFAQAEDIAIEKVLIFG